MNDRADLLIELGCEELPARLLSDQSRLLGQGLAGRLAEAGLIETSDDYRLLATPRRLAVQMPAVLSRQADRKLERKGPALNVAFDADGKPTRAAEGFARSVGRTVEELDRLETDQGAWLYAEVTEPGRSLADLLPELLEQTIREMAGARSMRWSDRQERFLRPVRWLLVLHGNEVLDIEAFGLKAGRITQGHRVHAAGGHEVPTAEEYEQVLAQAHVVVDGQARNDRIRSQVEALIDQAGYQSELDESLLDENAGLTEWPVAVIGEFDEDFLQVPEEALISSMQQHQKCFPLRNPDGTLANRFVAVANIDSNDPAAMIAGFERVIRPRLADARFFWQQDCKITLDERRSRLDEVLFQEKLGSVGAKIRRLETLVGQLAPALKADPETTARAAALCKSDLVTEMVGEFPELQGIMGGHYARVNGESDEVAVAIASHYQPRQSGDALPTDPAGQTLALADRLDTLIGIFAAGKKPKGGKDPFALRRAGLGIIRILEQSRLDQGLDVLIAAAADVLEQQLDVPASVRDDVAEFLMDRLRSHAADAGIEANTVHAVAAGKRASVADFMARAHAVQAFSQDPRAESLISANKRGSNLLKQVEDSTIAAVDRILLKETAEKDFFGHICQAEEALQSALASADYPSALATLSTLKEPVDRFFEEVMVMVEDKALRNNRLALLKQFCGLISDIADLARLGR
jgi:glycyl-tRNA synthetase beta chain